MTLDKRKLTELIKAFGDDADRAVASLAEDMTTAIKMSMQQKGTGRTYKRGSKTHTASAPGEPPAVDNGELRGSIRIMRMGNMHYRIVDGVEYGIYLEFGTRHMAKRPFVRPVFERYAGGQAAVTLERLLRDKLK